MHSKDLILKITSSSLKLDVEKLYLSEISFFPLELFRLIYLYHFTALEISIHVKSVFRNSHKKNKKHYFFCTWNNTNSNTLDTQWMCVKSSEQFSTCYHCESSLKTEFFPIQELGNKLHASRIVEYPCCIRHQAKGRAFGKRARCGWNAFFNRKNNEKAFTDNELCYGFSTVPCTCAVRGSYYEQQQLNTALNACTTTQCLRICILLVAHENKRTTEKKNKVFVCFSVLMMTLKLFVEPNCFNRT